MRELVEEITKPDVDPRQLMAMAHAPKYMRGVWWYSLKNGDIRISKDPDVNHDSDLFKDVAHKLGWIKGRVSECNGKFYLLLYVLKETIPSIKMVDLLHKIEGSLKIDVDHVFDSDGHDLYKMFEDVDADIMQQFSVRAL